MADRKDIEAELSEIQENRNELEYELKQCKEVRDYVQQDKIRRELRILANRAKHLLFKLGKYRYDQDEIVEFQPGEFMDANIYHWLKE